LHLTGLMQPGAHAVSVRTGNAIWP
jgi:hypothetical protein